ncbi:hypothetical protein ACHWQZ_G004684 [Mnemiopsis leidyi]
MVSNILVGFTAMSIYALALDSGTSDSKECELVEVGDERKYLKEKCGDKFKCPRSDVLYSVELYTDDPLFNKWSTNCTLKYDRLCPNDQNFYEVCGHIRSECESNFGRDLEEKFCRTYTCQYQGQVLPFLGEEITLGYKIISGLANKRYAGCNGELTCSNTDVDEKGCPDPGASFLCMGESKSYIRADQECDLTCDCHRCNDEAECGNRTYGVMCDSTFGNHVHAMYVCNGQNNCYNGLDEQVCEEKDKVRECIPGELHGPRFYNIFPNMIRSLFPHQICAVPRLGPYAYTCQDGLDQINCSDSSRVAMQCNMRGFPTTLSVFAICLNYDLCDDGYQNQCVEVEGGCLLHRNQLCDKEVNCPQGTDETKTFCSTLSTQICTRRVKMSPNKTSKQINFPMSWVMDGHQDCEDGIDENVEYWRKCGSKETLRYVEKDENCNEVFLCDTEDQVGKFVTFENLCDKVPSCGIENIVCWNARNVKRKWDFVAQNQLNVKYLSYCLPGMEKLEHLIGSCSFTNFIAPDRNILGVQTYKIYFPEEKQECGNAFGELYVHLSCTDKCNHAKCPLGRVKQNSCVNILNTNKVYSLTEDYSLAIVARSRGGYVNKYFSCNNSQCVTYDKVCNLVNDCGDDSDEKNCINHFKCAETSEYVLKTAVCDGIVDCRDFSDECGNSCSLASRNLLQNTFLKAFAWLSGILATLLNLTIILTSLGEIVNSQSLRNRMDKSLISLIAVGDLLIGVYLLAIAGVDAYYSEAYCKKKFVWLTSAYCNILGTFSTVGSQLSLFSMAALGVSRLANIKRLVPEDPSTIKSKIKLSATVAVLVIASLAISVFPLFPQFEDFFVNGLHYDGVTLFTGMVDKETHHRVLQSYNGRYREQPISWKTVRRMVGEMFSKDYEGIAGTKVEFYGSDSVCIFKYLVTKSDPQHVFSLAILTVNFLCFLFITACYTIIQLYVVNQSNAVVSKVSSTRRRDLKLQTKVSIIIGTDFLCWIPFIVVCALHFFEAIDAAAWYSVFSVIILPFNSVINPLLYSDMVFRKGNRMVGYFTSTVLTLGRNVSTRMDSTANTHEFGSQNTRNNNTEL